MFHAPTGNSISLHNYNNLRMSAMWESHALRIGKRPRTGVLTIETITTTVCFYGDNRLSRNKTKFTNTTDKNRIYGKEPC